MTLTIKELLEGAIEHKLTDLQAMIMFLAFEKQVIDLEGGKNQLDLYLLPKHKERMQHEITQYKKIMNIEYPACFWLVGETVVYAKDVYQASKLAKGKVEYLPHQDIYFKDRYMNLKELEREHDYVVGTWIGQ